MDKIGFVREVKKEWKLLWNEKFDDSIRSEGVALKDYPLLFVEKGLVVYTSKGCCIDRFEKIVAKHENELDVKFISPPDPKEGGYGKFIREVIKKQPRYRHESAR
ncbi:MAG: hypothetical protein ACFFCW_48445 [Candidatus Hodarchaeota archaeon]